MATAFQKVYTKIGQITKATVSLKARGVGYDELATINGKLAQVVKIAGDDVTLQVFEGTGGIPTNAEVVFLGKAPSLKVGEQLAGRCEPHRIAPPEQRAASSLRGLYRDDRGNDAGA